MWSKMDKLNIIKGFAMMINYITDSIGDLSPELIMNKDNFVNKNE